MVLIMCGQALWIMSLESSKLLLTLPAFSFKTKEGRASKGRAEVARMGPRKTSPINLNLCIFFILKQPDNTSGGIPWVSPATVIHQTLRYNKPEAKNKFDILSQWLLGLFSQNANFHLLRTWNPESPTNNCKWPETGLGSVTENKKIENQSQIVWKCEQCI